MPLVQKARQLGIPIRCEDVALLQRLAQGGPHQGLVACVDPFRYASWNEILSAHPDLVLVLDGMVDPRNLGALLRTAEAVGVGGVLLPQNRSASVTPTVIKASAGAAVHLRICRVPNLARCLGILRSQGYWTVGLCPEASQSLFSLEIRGKAVLVIGGEEKGIRPLVRRFCDFVVAIPMRGHIESLNASVAGALALYELFRLRALGSSRASSNS